MTEWKPIETAPKDGRTLLCCGIAFGDWGYTSDEIAVYFVSWYRYKNIDMKSPEGGKWQVLQPVGRYWNGFEPTHWLEIPPLPEIKIKN